MGNFALNALSALAILVVIMALRSNRGKNHRQLQPSPKPAAAPVPPHTKSECPPAHGPLSIARNLTGPAYVIDGDSLRIKGTDLRLFGTDAPELTPHGRKAKWELVRLCKGQTVRAVLKVCDHYNRMFAQCFLEDGRDLSAEMVKAGLALDWPKFSGGRYRPLEVPGARRKMWLADARQKGRMHVWQAFQARQSQKSENIFQAPFTLP